MNMSVTALELARPQTAVEVRAQVNLIQEVMRAVMLENIHYGVIPGTKKPTLYKPGSEKLLSTFHIAIEPIVEDLSTSDEARFRVITRATSVGSGAYLGSGVGEASSAEDKYQWRASVCDAEFDATPEDRRRLKFKVANNTEGYYTIKQVRTNVPDIANTVLKMAKKRSQIDVTLTVTGASDIFSQDIEDLPEEYRDTVADEHAQAAPVAEIKRKSETAPPPPASPATGVALISEAQGKRFYAIYKNAGKSDQEVREYLKSKGISHSRDIPKSIYEELCAWAER
jgi:hypothetical protein